jgi:uncharacterized protein (TIGR03067 family)
VSSIVVLLLFVGGSVGTTKTKAADPQAASPLVGIWHADSVSPLVGVWHADSVSISREGGQRKTLNEQDRVGLFVTDKTFTLRAGRPILAEMSYVSDPNQKPGAIDLKSKDGELAGIYTLDKDRLTISLNDKEKGRPSDFNEKTNGMVLRLHRAYGVALYMIDADGGNLHRIAALPDFWYLGATDVSSGGRKVVFNAWQAIVDSYYIDNHVFVANGDGSEVKDLGWGSGPTLSPDEKQIVCIEHGQPDQPERGIWIMNADGTGRKMLDPEGTCAQWSRNRNEIAYVANHGNTMSIVVYDVAKQERRSVPLENDYSYITPSVAWSPDGKWICFEGHRADGSGIEVAAVSAEEGKKELKSLLMVAEHPEIENVDGQVACLGPDNNVLLAMKTKTTKTLRLHILDFAGRNPPKLFPGIPADWVSLDPASSPDGKKVLFSSSPNPPKAADKP